MTNMALHYIELDYNIPLISYNAGCYAYSDKITVGFIPSIIYVFVYLVDNQRLNLMYSLLVVGNHHDQYQIEDHFNNLFKYYDRVVNRFDKENIQLKNFQLYRFYNYTF